MALVPSGLFLLDGFDDYQGGGEVGGGLMASFGYAYANDMYITGYTPHGAGRALYGINRYGFEQSASYRPLGGDCAHLIYGSHILLGTATSGGIKLVGFTRENGLGGYSDTVWVIVNGQRGLTITNDAQNIAYHISKPAIFFTETWYHMELKLDWQGGKVQLRLDEQLVIDEDMHPNLVPQGVVNMMRTYGQEGALRSDLMIDNMYMLNGQGAAAPFNDFLGECIIHTARPDGDTGPNQFQIIGSAGETEHWQVVDDEFVDDSNYLQTSEANDGEYFSVVNVPADTIEVLAVSVAARMRKEAGAPARYRAKARIGANETVFPTRTISGTFETKSEFMMTKPGGGAWTIADANQLQIGVETLA